MAALALLALVGSTGCAMLASANAAHSHISPCVSDTGFAAVDFGLAAATTGLLVDAVDEDPTWMLLPATFVASGVIGAISAERCRRGGDRPVGPAPVYQALPPPPPLSTLPLATPADLGLAPPDPASATVNLQVDPSYGEPRDPSPSAPAAPGQVDPPAAADAPTEPGVTDTVPCAAQRYLECPAHQECRESVDLHARCVPRR